MKKTLVGIEKEFDERFVIVVPDPKHMDYGKEVINEKYPNRMRAFIRQQILDLLKEVRGEMPQIPIETPITDVFLEGTKERELHIAEHKGWNKGYNSALSDVKATLDKIIKSFTEK